MLDSAAAEKMMMAMMQTVDSTLTDCMQDS